MSSEELITKQAEMVLADDPGIPGGPPRVWAYRNGIKALNWFAAATATTTVRAYSLLLVCLHVYLAG